MPTTKNNDGSESYEYTGKDWCLIWVGMGLFCFFITIGIGGCLHLGDKTIRNNQIENSNN